MKLKERVKAKLNKSKTASKFLDYDFRTVVFTVISLIITAGYAVFYAVMGISLISVWYGMLASYYFMIVAMRATVVFYHGRKSRRKGAVEEDGSLSRARIYCICGITICLLTLPLSIVILLMIAEKATFSSAGLMIYVTAAYTTVKVVLAIRHAVKARKSQDLTVRTVRSINLADMLVSVLALQTAMFNSFSANFNTDIFNAVTGAAVCVGTLVIGIFMIFGGWRAVIKTKYEANLKKEQDINERD